MKKNLKLILTFLFIFNLISGLFAQISEDPNHNFYKDTQRWQIQGIVKNVPALRPYPLNIIKDILTQVINNGNEKEIIKANEYLEEITGKPFYLYGEATANTNIKDGGVSLFGSAEGDLDIFSDFVSIGYRIGFNGYTNKAAKDYFAAFNPYFSALPYDTVQDPGKLGPLYGYFNSNENLAVGNKIYFFQMGINRLGYGDFIGQNLALNESSYHSANLAFTIMKNRWNYSQVYSAIGASKAFDGSSLKNDKYLVFHQFECNLTDRIQLAYYETIILGNRFDFSYIIPAPYMATQGIGGCNDNLQMGIRFNYKPINNLLWANDIYVDDISFNDLAKLKFDTKIRIAATTGLIYVFDNPLLNQLSANYTLITPYTYTHWDFSDPNTDLIDKNTYSYQNYTNNGIPMGSLIPPNSDNVKISMNMSPINKLDVNFDFGFIRHGNSAETITTDEALIYLMYEDDVYATDGSIFNHTFYPKHNVKNDKERESQYLDSAWYYLNFLNQKNKMYIFQGSVSAKYSFNKTKVGLISLKVGYSGEYIINKGVDTNLYNNRNVIFNQISDNEYTYSYNNTEYTNAEDLIEQIKEDWKSTFTNCFNNFLYLGVEWKF